MQDQDVLTVTMTDLFEREFVQSLSRSSLHKRLIETNQGQVSKINPVSKVFMERIVKEIQKYKPSTMNDLRCFESDGFLIGASYDKAFIAYPEHFGNQSVAIEGSDSVFNLDGKSFGLISSMLVCRELSSEYEKKGDWYAVLDLLEAYFATHDAFLSSGRIIDLLPHASGGMELMEAYALDVAFRNILRLKSNDGVSGTYDRLLKAREIVNKPTLSMRIRRMLKAS